MTALNKTPQRLSSIVQGQYLLTDVTKRRSRHGEQFVLCRLKDSAGQIDVYVWTEPGLIGQVGMLRPVPVQAAFYVRRLGDLIIGNLRTIHAIDEPEVKNAARLLRLSDYAASARPALAVLERMVAALAPDVLRRFTNQVLLEPRVSHDILTRRANQRHHHAEQGGLLFL